MQNRILFFTLWLTTVVCFCIGVTIPAFIMHVTLDSFWIDAVAQALLPKGTFGITKLSILGSVWKLISSSGAGDLILGVLIFSFSVLFPAIKYTLLITAYIRSYEARWAKKILKFGYWSMLDVFVVAVLVVSFKGFPGGSRIIPAAGIYFFAASVILSYFTHKTLERCIPKKLLHSH